ncbi:coiled-coil domain-containing protein 68 [Tiliqua scincoides]|uniref:coiled-coil domain-containing protein 68 n=1 Tax=Tiliqua scincoides TaxID=71010 RepID=UPI003462FABC
MTGPFHFGNGDDNTLCDNRQPSIITEKTKSQIKCKYPKIRIMTTTLVVTRHILREDQGTEGNFLLYGTTTSEITEETEYIKQIRSTLAKVQSQLCKSESCREVADGMLDSKPHFQESGWDFDEETLASSYKETMEKIKRTEDELLRVNKENEQLKFKLEAVREAGAESVKIGARKLRENYHKRSDDLKKRHEGVIHLMKARKLEQEEKLKHSTDGLRQLNVRLFEKYVQIEELEKRVQRMEEEKKTLKEKKRLLKEKLQRMMSNAEDTKRCAEVQTDIFTLQEQISHLDHVIHSQHQNLHNVIQQMEELNNELKHQDERIADMKEKIEMLQAKNKELKYKVDFYTEQSEQKASKSVSARIDGALPYTMLARLHK